MRTQAGDPAQQSGPEQARQVQTAASTGTMPASLAAPGRTAVFRPSFGLARAAGNAAFSQWMVQRSTATVQRSVTAPESAALAAVEARLAVVRDTANARGDDMLHQSDNAVHQLQEATLHVQDVATQYRLGHDRVTDVLTRADKQFDTDNAISDAVMGLAIAVVFAALLPETLLVGAGVAAVRAMVGAATQEVSTIGSALIGASQTGVRAATQNAANAAANQVGQIGIQQGIKTTADPNARPTTTAGGAGASTSDKYAEMLGHVAELVQAMPALGESAGAIKTIALDAANIRTTSAQLRAGDQLPASVADVQNAANTIESALHRTDQAAPQVNEMVDRLVSLHNQMMIIPIRTADEVELDLWTRWIAGLYGNANEILDNDVIQKYLTAKGMLTATGPFGWLLDADQARAVTAAQERWLRAHNVEPGPNPETTLSNFKGHTRLLELRSRTNGRRGTMTDARHVEIDGARYDYAGNSGPLTAGTTVTALDVEIKQYYTGRELIDNWTNDNYDVYCNVVATPAPATP
jgi:hypothetical protein